MDHNFVDRYGVCHKWPWRCSVCSNHRPVISSFVTYHRVCNKSNTMGTTGYCLPFRSTWVHTWFLVGFMLFDLVAFCVMLCRSVCPFSFGHGIFCSPSIYGFWLPFWHLQTFLCQKSCFINYPFYYGLCSFM